MMGYIKSAKRFLREFVEIGFLVVLAIILVHLIAGPNSGAFPEAVAANVAKFIADVTAPGLIGIAIIITICYLIAPRWR